LKQIFKDIAKIITIMNADLKFKQQKLAPISPN